MRIEVLPDAEATARRAAGFIAGEARRAVAERGSFLLALSGGATPRLMLERLAAEDVPWPRVHLFQVDERAVPEDDPERNLRQLREALLEHVPLPAGQLHAMPVEDAFLEVAATRYAATLQEFAGWPALLDLVHLGLGADGHTASLVPSDRVADVRDADVAVSGPYRGQRRMTLTLPLLDRARAILWLVTGADKREVLARLLRGDRTIPAGRVRAERALVVADAAAARPGPPAKD
jgi:6-phosphogluconolactonase